MKFNFVNVLVIGLLMLSAIALFTLSGGKSDGQCPTQEGVIFIDCVDPSWHGISSWEVNFQTRDEMVSADGGDLVNWKVVDTDSPRGHVLDVKFSKVPANGRLRFHVTGSGQHVDFTDYADGHLTFDVRVLDWGWSERMLVVRVLCGYPCGSESKRFSVPKLNEWHSVKISVAELIESGLDASKVDIGLAISPTWNRMQGVHFQMDNIRWVKGESNQGQMAGG